MNLKERVIKCLQYRFPSHEVGMETHLRKDLDADSLSLMELVMDLEDEFDVNIPEAALPRLVHVRDVISYLEEV